MTRLLIDQDFNHRILRAVLRLLPELEYATALNLGLDVRSDDDLLEWATTNDSIVLTHDEHTMHLAMTARFDSDKTLPRVVVVPRSLPIGQVAEELELLFTCGEANDWVNGLVRLPLS